MSTLMAIKLLALIGSLAAFVWWQMRDLAKEKKRAEDHTTTSGHDAP
jgi:hypothetical protein